MRTPHFVAHATGMRSHAFVHNRAQPCQSRAIAVQHRATAVPWPCRAVQLCIIVAMRDECAMLCSGQIII
jgi:hypothetical protein